MALRNKPDSRQTKKKLIDAAGPVFARGGFRAATVQEICARAGANIAAVNYHFGDKLGLYREVLRSSRASSAEVRRAGGSQEPPAQQRLRFFIRGLLTHLFGEGRPTWFAQVIAHEMAEPTPALKQLIEIEARPGFERLKQMVREITRLPAGDDRVVLCANSIMGQCLHYFHSRPVVAELWPELRMTGERIDQIAGHITAFSLAGLHRVRAKTAEANSTKPHRPRTPRRKKGMR